MNIKYKIFVASILSVIALSNSSDAGKSTPDIISGAAIVGPVLIDEDNAEAFLCRKDGDAGDIAICDTISETWQVDTVTEITTDAGVTIDGVLLKDSVVTGALVGNADTATALAANPADCAANEFANVIAANGALTCAALADADIPDTITIDLAGTATALAANPTDCGANQFATTIAANGDLTCAAVADADVPDDINIATLSLTGLLTLSSTAGITASITQTQGQQALTTTINEISTCANTNDTVTLPTAAAGVIVVIINNGAETLKVFPASGDNVDGTGVDTAVTQTTGGNYIYVAHDATNWNRLNASL